MYWSYGSVEVLVHTGSNWIIVDVAGQVLTLSDSRLLTVLLRYTAYFGGIVTSNIRLWVAEVFISVVIK